VETWWTANWITYFLLRNEESIVKLQQQVNDYMKSDPVRKDAGLEGNNALTYHLEPLTKVHLYSKEAGFEPNGNISYIYVFGIIALLILIIACANYTNLSTAQSAGRSGEIGMRKVMGASKRQVFFQFIGESAFLTFIAAFLALLMAVLLVPYFNTITGKQFSSYMLLQPSVLIALIVFSLLVSFFAGLYPALILSSTHIIGVLKKGFPFTGGKHVLRKGLIIAQFAISVFLISYTIIIIQQIHYMQTKNIGYDKDHVVVLPIGGNMLKDFQNLKDAFSQIPGVEGVTASYETPEFVNWGDGITTVDEKGKHDISLNAMPVDLDYIKTMKMELVSGREFLKSDFALMDTTNNNENYRDSFIINEALAKKIGWTPEQAIGKTIELRQPGFVVGVVKDFNFRSFHEPIGPLLIFLNRYFSRDFMVRLNGNNIQETLGRLDVAWKLRIPDRPFNYHFLDEDYAKLYQSEQRSSTLFSVAAGLAIVLACLGLFSLAAFTTVQRTKEIGIRKTLGANIGHIVMLIGKNFLVLVSISIVIAVPFAVWASKQWLQNFTFKIEPKLYVFVIAAFVTILITLITVGFHSIKAAMANPTKSLRAE
jgi:putative ABC transport system permease protein